MAETDLHRDIMYEVIAALKAYYLGQQVYVTGNLLVFYEPGNKRRHVSPDCMVVKGAPPFSRLNYLIWEEGRSADVVVEITSRTTRSEDIKKKFEIYRSIMRVREYFLFDPTGDYLSPRLQGYRLIEDQYVPIEASAGRLFSEDLGLFLEGEELPAQMQAELRKRLKIKRKGTVQQPRFYDPRISRWLPTIAETVQIARERADRAEQNQRQAEQALRQAEQDQWQAEQAQRQAERAQHQAVLENARLKQELELLRKQLGQ